MAEQATTGGIFRSIAHRLSAEDRDLPDEGRLADFSHGTGWLNSAALTTGSLRGRIVLVNFWTYTCVNWLRTLPYLRAWNESYRDRGLTIVGVHTPEFSFESEVANVQRECARLGVTYPVLLDDDYGVWDAYANHYWPAIYLADADGRVRYHHFGEEEYVMTEMMIQRLLALSGSFVPAEFVDVEPAGLEVAADWRNLRSPETYLGYARSDPDAPRGVNSIDAPQQFHARPRLPLNNWDLSGTWTVTAEAARLVEPHGGIRVRFHARDVNLVMRAATATPVPFTMTLDGRALGADAGTDAQPSGAGTLARPGTYQLVRQRGPIHEATLEIDFHAPGAELYCLTFG